MGVIYDNEGPSYYDSGGYNHPRYTGGTVLLAIVILLMFFFWADLAPLRNNLSNWISGNHNPTALPAETSRTGNNTATWHVTADNLALRKKPSRLARASYALPRGTKVVLLGNTQQETAGAVWFKVRVETFRGRRIGWVNQQYLE
ncbi:MAG: SH3 domain-containing protein [Acidobacteria bacterium]|nr:SH3 domain-containing protein [Acidobacteriota bacterium]MBI3428155.1 SH3 domain-containing protein [Acidobacteriota bacterium]